MVAAGTFLRKALLTVGASQFLSDGTRNGFYMRFCIQRNFVGPGEDSEIILKNLTEKTRSALTPGLPTQASLLVRLEVGWENYGMRGLFQGALLRSYTVREGPDLVTTLKVRSGLEATANSTITRCYASGMSVKTALLDVAGQLSPAPTIDESRIRFDPCNIGPGGFSCAGSVKDVLDHLGDQYGFSWSIQDDVFQAFGDAYASDREPMEISSAGGTLFSASPLLQTAFQIKRGVEIRSLLIPGLLPGDQVRLQSVVSPDLSGVYRLHCIRYSGSPCEQDWSMTSQCFTFANG